LNEWLTAWSGQITTGHGCMIIAGTLFSVFTGSITWTAAAPLLVAAAVGLVWPENTALQTAARAAVTDVENVVAAYNDGAKRTGE
jgi:hypothetical protein